MLEEMYYNKKDFEYTHDNYKVYWLRTCVVEFINALALLPIAV